MKESLKKRLDRLEESCRSEEPCAVCVQFLNETREEAIQRHREETGSDPELFILFNRNSPVCELKNNLTK